MSIQELIKLISERPAMYFGEPTIGRFEAFIAGWMFAIGTEQDQKLLLGYNKWIQKKYEITTTHSWASIIRFYESDDISAMVRSFELFQEYFVKLDSNS